MAEGYVTEVAVDEDKEIIGYKFVNLGKMMESIAKGMDANEALEKLKVNTEELLTLLNY